MTDAWRPDVPEPEEPEDVEEPETDVPLDEAEVVAHFEPEATGLGLDGSTPLEAGIGGRLIHAGGATESERKNWDWEPYVEVDQPVQKVDE